LGVSRTGKSVETGPSRLGVLIGAWSDKKGPGNLAFAVMDISGISRENRSAERVIQEKGGRLVDQKKQIMKKKWGKELTIQHSPQGSHLSEARGIRTLNFEVK